MYDEDGNWIDLGGGSGGGYVNIISAPPEYDASGGGSFAPLSPEDEAQYQEGLASADAQAQLQAPNIQKISEQITNFQDILPADLTSQIQSMSQQLLQQQSVIQQDVQTTLAQQKATNDAATAYQEIYASASPQVTAATSDYNSSLAGYNQAYAQYAKSHNPNYLGSVLGQLQRDIPNVSAGWFLNKMNADKATITNLNNQITAASTAYANDLAAYKATAANLQASVSVYNANYTNYTGAVATANGDVKAAQDAAAAKVKADQQAAADKAAADKAAADAAAKANSTVTTGGTGNATVGGTAGNATTGGAAGNVTASTGGNAVISTGGTSTGNVTISGPTSGNGAGGISSGTGGILPGGANVAPTGNVTVGTTPSNTTTTITPVPSPNVTITATGPDNAVSNVANTTTATTATTPNEPLRTPTGSPFGPSTSLSSALLGTALSSQPEPAVLGGGGGAPYLLGTDEAKKNVWNQESLRNALGI